MANVLLYDTDGGKTRVEDVSAIVRTAMEDNTVFVDGDVFEGIVDVEVVV